jgi:aspartyl-tRNA(Asn)/glutamyl-tRNA(Gln) amidotransferase subunit B
MSAEDYQLIVGLEVHVQLKTQTKLFCGCSTTFGAPPNTQTCPVCLGHPGSLPVINREAIRLAVRTGLALESTIPPSTKWDRKNYFYPDLPKGYQISQFDQPICQGGKLTIPGDDDHATRVIRITRAHLEEDAGKSMHDEVAGSADSRIDLNRTGTPLLEIVSEPDLRSAQEAKNYLSELKLLLTYLQVSDCNMQEGSLRVDANVNLHLQRDGETVATPIVEIKNLNSFRAVERALEYEAQRQYEAFQETGQRIGEAPKQTRGWDDALQVTKVQREKEESSDYRYFPDPDLVPIVLPAAWVDEVKSDMGELPGELRGRLRNDYGLPPYDADVIVNQGPEIVNYFETVAQSVKDPKRASNWIQQEVLRSLNETECSLAAFPIQAETLAALIGMIESGDLDNSRGRDVYQWLMENKGTPETAMKALGIESVDSDEMLNLCRQLIAAHPTAVADFQAGKKQALGAMIGAARKLNPNANPGQVKDLLVQLMSETP